jgi:lipopolysaccharide export system ATP-binding protein
MNHQGILPFGAPEPPSAATEATGPRFHLATRQLCKSYDGRMVVDHVDMDVHSGEVVALLGRNGAGKTTTFLMLAGIVAIDMGRIEIDGVSIEAWTSSERSKQGLIYLPQQHSVFMKATAYDNLFMVLQLYQEERQAREEAERLLMEFGLLDVRDSDAYQLSGGEKRRLEIARAMIMSPRFLFLDEPFTGIDPITIQEIQRTIMDLKKKGIGVIITDHNVKDTFYISDRVTVIHQGKVLSSGIPARVVADPETRKLFLGESFNWASPIV